MADEADAFAHGKGFQGKVFVDPVLEVGHPLDDRCQFRLSENDDLQQLFGVGFKVEQFAQDFQRGGGQLLAFVDEEDQIAALVQRTVENAVLDEAHAVAPGSLFGRALAGQQLAQMAHEGVGVLKARIEQQEDVHALLAAERAQKAAAERALAGAHFPEHDVEPPAQAGFMGRRPIVGVGIGRIGKRLPRKIEQFQITHGRSLL